MSVVSGTSRSLGPSGKRSERIPLMIAVIDYTGNKLHRAFTLIGMLRNEACVTRKPICINIHAECKQISREEMRTGEEDARPHLRRARIRLRSARIESQSGSGAHGV